MTGKEFIQECLIKDIGEIVRNKQYYHAFALISIGIEFLGKCLHTHDIHKDGFSSQDFKKALKYYESLKKYQAVPKLYINLRCGLLHAFLPKEGVKLTNIHNDFPANTIGCKELYDDFVIACRDAINNTHGYIKRDLNKTQLVISGPTSGTPTEMSKSISRSHSHKKRRH